MIKVYKYNITYEKLWNDFVKNSKNGIFLFNRNFMEYHSDRFEDNSLLFFDNDELVALLPANIKDGILYSHQGLTYGGFITNEKMKQHRMIECFDILNEYAREKNIKKLIYKSLPYIFFKQPADEDLYALFLNNAKLLWIKPSTVLNLLNPLKMPKGRKAQISRAQREGVVIEESNDFDTFIDLENEVLKLHHNAKTVHTAEELKLLKSKFENNIRLYVAKYDDEIIAGALLFIYEGVVHTQYLGANDKAREIGALDLLIKTLIDEYGITHKYFDFGTSVERDEKILNTGLISQKEGFGARSVGYYCWEVNF